LRFPLSDSADLVLSMAAALTVLLISPELLRHVLHTQRLPESRLRQNLSDICARAGVGCREILLWRTQNNMGNAAVMGLIPQVRYVMLSDLLLESMTDLQIQAVFAHELGHVKHRHLAWFVVFLLAIPNCLSALTTLLENHLKLTESWREVYDFSSIFVCGAVLLVGYGFLSRWFERQADVYAARALEQPVTDADSSPDGLGAAIFASALERVAIVNNIPITARNWTHGSIHSRMRYIHRLGQDPEVAARFDRTGRRVFFGLIFLILICTCVAIYGGLHG
jgi:STE24 endopeptidase